MFGLATREGDNGESIDVDGEDDDEMEYMEVLLEESIDGGIDREMGDEHTVELDVFVHS